MMLSINNFITALDPHYATLLSLSPSENDVFVDMMYELLDHQMTVPEVSHPQFPA